MSGETSTIKDNSPKKPKSPQPSEGQPLVCEEPDLFSNITPEEEPAPNRSGHSNHSEYEIGLITRLVLAANRVSLLDLAPRLKKEGIKFDRYLLLEELSRKQSMAMNEVAERLAISSAGATGVGDQLVKLGLASRCFDRGDRRIASIQLTPQGHRFLNELHKMFREIVAEEMAAAGELSRAVDHQRDWMSSLEN